MAAERPCPPAARTVGSGAAALGPPRARRRARRSTPSLRRAVQPVGRRVEPLPVPGQLADRPDRVAARRSSGRTFGLRRRRWARTSGRPSSQIGRRPRYSAQRLRGSMTAPPPVAITRRTAGSGSAAPRRSTAGSLEGPERRLAVVREDLAGSAGRRPSRSTSSRSTNVGAVAMGEPPPDGALAAARAARRGRRPLADHVSRRRRSRHRRRSASPATRPAAAATRPSGAAMIRSRSRSSVVARLGDRVAAELVEHRVGEGRASPSPRRRRPPPGRR